MTLSPLVAGALSAAIVSAGRGRSAQTSMVITGLMHRSDRLRELQRPIQ